jgi:Polyketide cyclase / dehydrase and lipid transport
MYSGAQFGDRHDDELVIAAKRFGSRADVRDRTNRLTVVKRPWFRAEPVDETFFDRAPVRLRETFEIPFPAEKVWGDLTSENPLWWCRVIQRISWTSPPPLGVGTTRTARALGGLNIIHERFFIWEEGRRQSFYALEISVPGFRHFAEDYLLEPGAEHSCRFTWTIAIEPKPAAQVVVPANRVALRTLFTDTRKHYGAG